MVFLSIQPARKYGDTAERVDDTDGEAFVDADYYFGGEDDGAMTVGWLQLDITYTDVDNSVYNAIAPVFTDDEDQTRWFYFKSNGKKVKSDGAEEVKEKTINGKKYGFDQYGAMVAEWSADVKRASDNHVDIVASKSDSANKKSVSAKYAQQWRYFNDVENGAKVSKGWFKVVSAEYLNDEKYNDDEDAWYYAEGNGDIYAGELKTIKGKKYAFRNDGRMINGLKFIADNGSGLSVIADDDDDYPFDTEDGFNDNAPYWEAKGYRCYYFGDGDDGAMRTNKTTITIDGDNFNFLFEKSGSKKGAGKTGEDDKKLYQSGMLLRAGKDEKYQVVKALDKDKDVNDDGKGLEGYKKLEDVKEFVKYFKNADGSVGLKTVDPTSVSSLSNLGISKKADDIDELYVIPATDKDGKATKSTYSLVNTAGKVIKSKSKNKDGNDYYYSVDSNGVIMAVYTEK